MDSPVNISLVNLQENSKNFNFLQQQGMELIRQIGSATWTDHNLHDPGITLLETLCYAVTEAGLQAGAVDSLDSAEDDYKYIANLLTSGQQTAPQDFFTAAQVLPSSPVSLVDFQKVLLDHPIIKRAWVSVVPGIPAGNLSVLQQFNPRVNNVISSPVTENIDLNSNILRTKVTLPGSPPDEYEIEIAFPYWDDPEAAPFQRTVIITNLAFNNNPLNPWIPITGTDSYFTFLNFLLNDKSASWPIVVRIVSSSTELFPAIKDAILTAFADSLITPSSKPSLLNQYNQKVIMAFESSHRIRSYLKNYRNLCESFSTFRSVRIQGVAIACNIEMGAGADIESLLANIFYAVYQYISPGIFPKSLSDLQGQMPTEAIFDGPLLSHGFISDSLFSNNLPANALYVSDVVLLIMKMGTGPDIQIQADDENRPVVSVTNVSLSLYLDNRSITTGARDCLKLVNSSRHIPQLSLEKCNISVTRNNTAVSYNITKLLDLYNNKITAGNRTSVNASGAPADIPIPVGEALAMGEYYSIQNDLPVTYGVGKAGLPSSSSAERLGKAKQLQGYLFLFEQVLAGYFTQLAHVNALFSANASASATLYQLPLYNVPATQELLMPVSGFSTWQDFMQDEHNSYRKVLKTSVETKDQFLSRRHQMLDHLLGRHGEDMQAFSSLIYRQSYSDSNTLTAAESAILLQEASSALLQFKADYYYALPDLEKNRAQGYGHPAWRNKNLVNIYSSPDGTSFLWQILDGNGHILFRQSVPEKSKAAAEEMAEAALVLATSEVNYTIEADPNGSQRIALRWSAGGESMAISNKIYDSVSAVADAQNDIPIMQQMIQNLWLKYSLSSLEARLYHLLGMKIKGERGQLINPGGTDEGFYMIEHNLLYPVTPGDTPLVFPDYSSSCLPVSSSGVQYSLPNDPYSFILTIAFPSGYTRDFSHDSLTSLKQDTQPHRFRDLEFRQYAEQTIRKFCPAHILPLVIWVDTALPGTPLMNSPEEPASPPSSPPSPFIKKPYPCFDNLESTYRTWLAAFFTDDIDFSTIAPLRKNLVSVLNGIFFSGVKKQIE